MPQPLEVKLCVEALIENAVVMGVGRKYCTALIFPDQDALGAFAKTQGLGEGLSIGELVRHPQIVAHVQTLVDQANEGMDHWSTIKRFVLVPDHLTIENGLLTPTLKVKRSKVRAAFEKEFDALYEEDDNQPRKQHAGVAG